MSRLTLISLCLLAGAAGSLAVPTKREATAEAETQPKITYSKETLTKDGEEVKLDCAVVGVDLDGVEDFGVSWSKIDEENPTNSFPISANDKILLFGTKYTIDHPADSYQYSLVIKEVSEEDTGKYRCTVNFGGDQKINAEVPVHIQKAPYFTDDFTKTLTVTEGDAISIDCQPGGWPKPDVYWERLGQELPYYGGKFFKSNQLDIPLIERDHEGHYVCYADNDIGDPANSHIILEVQFAPEVVVEEKQVFAAPSDPVKMACTVFAKPSADIAWYKDDQAILGGANMKISKVELEEGKGFTTTLSIGEASAENFGSYSCRAVNAIGKTEQTIEVRMKSAPLIVKQSRSEVLYDLEKTNLRDALPVVIECEAEGHPTPDFRWTKNGAQLVWQADPRFSLEDGTGNLLISDPTMDDNGLYQCFAYNELGTAVGDPVYLLNTTRIEFSNNKDNTDLYPVEAELGRPYKLSCPEATGYPKPSLNWVKAIARESQIELEFVSDERIVADPDGNLWFTHITEDDATADKFKYMCLGSTEFEPADYSIASTIELSVVSPADGNVNSEEHSVNVETFSMYTSPETVTFQAEQENTLWCIYGGEPVPSVEWRRTDGEEMDKERFVTRNFGRTLVVKDTMLSDAGEYECRSSNGVGASKSTKIQVEVEMKPTFRSELASQTVREGATVTFTCDAEATGEVVYNWIFNGRVLDKDGHHRRTLAGNKLTINDVSVVDVGNYACNATSSVGYAYGQAVLNVIPMDRSAGGVGGGSCGGISELKKEISALRETVDTMHNLLQEHFSVSQHNHEKLQKIAESMGVPEMVQDDMTQEEEMPKVEAVEQAEEEVTTEETASA